MRAMAIDRPKQIPSLHTLPDPSPIPAGHVLVRVKAAALNPADLKVIDGEFAGRFLHARRFPLVSGYDFSGLVESVGDGVTTLSVGAEVFGFLPYAGKTAQGSFADFVAVPVDTVAPKPAGVSHAVAAASGTTGCTALQALRDKGRLAEGAKVLINGASGGVGSHAVQIARLLGAEVTGTCSAAKADYVRELGAHRVVDYRETPLSALRGPFDVILDAAATGSYGRCRHLLSPTGAYVTTLPGPGLMLGALLSLFSKRSSAFIVVQPVAADLARLGEWLAAGTLRTPIDRAFTLEELPEAIAHLRSGAVRGKIAIEVG